MDFKLNGEIHNKQTLTPKQAEFLKFLNDMKDGQLYTRRHIVQMGVLEYSSFTRLPDGAFDAFQSWEQGSSKRGRVYGNANTIKAYNEVYGV